MLTDKNNGNELKEIWQLFKGEHGRSLAKRALSLLLAFVMLVTTVSVYDYTGIFSYFGLTNVVNALDKKYNVPDYTTQQTITIDGVTYPYYELSSQAALILYSQAYYDWPGHEQDVIKIDLGAGSVTDPLVGYESIGNSYSPFQGRIYFGASSYTTLNLDCPFLGTVYDSVQVYTAGTTTPAALTITRIDDAIDEPLFVRKVLHDSSASVHSNWSVTAAQYTDGINVDTYPFAGFIGVLDSDAEVTITAVNNAVKDNGSAQITSSNNNIGLLCQTIGARAKLTATCAGTNHNYNVTTGKGNAGGLVGQMGIGSQLTVYLSENPQMSGKTISTDSGYAGGIVGYNEGGEVTLNLSSVVMNQQRRTVRIPSAVTPTTDEPTETPSTEAPASAEPTVAPETDIPSTDEPTEAPETETPATAEPTETPATVAPTETPDPVDSADSNDDSASGSGYLGGFAGLVGIGSPLVEKLSTILRNETTDDLDTPAPESSDPTESSVSVEPAESTTSAVPSSSDTYTTVTYYAGATVRKVAGAVVTLNDPYTVNQKISGTTATGAVYGYYRPAFTNNAYTFDIKDYNLSGATLEATGSIGGLFGELNNEVANSDVDTITINSSGSRVTVSPTNTSKSHVNYGGLIGAYTANETADVLLIDGLQANITNNAEITNYGGAIGLVNTGSYVRFNGFTLTNATHITADDTVVFGGLVANAEGAYIYVNGATIGTSVLSDFNGGGLVGTLGNGVLGMTGNINLSNAKPTAAAGNGQIVGQRDNALIYAEGSTWSYTPSNVEVDNVGSWGDVVWFDGTRLAKEDVIASEANHIITITTVTSSAIDSAADYAVVSLLFQINPANNSFINGSQLSENVAIGFTGNVNLTGTGLRGITRDNGSSRYTYKGTITGNNNTVTLDIKNIGGSNRPVYYHTYNGLLGSASSVTVNNLYLSGSIIVKPKADNKYIGAFAASAAGTLNASGCETLPTLTINITAGSTYVAGRFIGNATKMNTINVSGCEFDGTISGTGDKTVGGVFGFLGVADSGNPIWTFENVTLKGSVTGVKTVGGLAAEVSGSNRATMSLGLTSGVVIDGLVVSGSSSTNMGGLLGYNWRKTDVELKKVYVSNKPVVSYSSTGGTAGLVYRATGHWTVTDLALTDIKMDASNASNIGMIVNKGTEVLNESNTDKRYGIYLELPAGYSYDLSLTDDSSISATAVFDEICAYSADNASDIMKNEQGIVSISTNGLKMETTAEDSLSYKSKTTQGATANPNTRYYYNLDLIDDNADLSSNPASQLMCWGVYQYACDNIRSHFASDSFTFDSSKTYDLKGYSWYPVTPRESVPVAGTFKFYNKEFHACEGQKADDNKWYPNASNQHFMMQNGLFYDVNHNLTIGAVVLQGTIGAIGADGTGALIYGTVSGSSPAQSDITVVDSTNGSIRLDGIKVWNFTTAPNANDYAPLLINKTGSYVNLQISNVSTSNYSAGSTAGTSLIGRAGGDDDTYVNIDFKKIKLDARSSENDPTLTVQDYPTTKSIFTRATLLERLVGESGTYNYTYDDDWGSGGHNVTYGEEVGYSSEGQYPDDEHWYARASTSETKYATSHSVAPDDEDIIDTDFNKFLPYVKDVSTASEISTGTGKYYQLKVNHQPTETIEGCGTYNDPYIIKSAEELIKISRWITDNDLNTATINAAFGDAWCDSKTEHKTYNGVTGSFINTTDSSDVKTNEEMRKYLCSAYYKIDPLGGNVIELDSSSLFRGLGIKDAGFRFRGVIVGAGNGATIKNKTAFPIVAYSEGSVIKNLTIEVDTSDLKINNNYKGYNYLNGQKQNYIYWNNGTQNPMNIYGSVIGAIVGGDNIIDSVQVDLDSAKFCLASGNAQYTAIGGYVGVIIDGGLVFRNMTGSIAGLNDNTKITNNQSKTPTTMIDSDNNSWMFVNPIIGRVINGYAVTETDAYKPREANVTMKNSTGNHEVVKNYSITDIASSGSSLSINNSSKTIAISDSQEFVLLSYIVNSGAASNLLGYQTTSGDSNYYFMRRHASYSDVGSSASSSSLCDDYNSHAKKDSVASSSVPYLIYKYASGTTPSLSNDWTINLSTNGNYDLSDGFRGIGNFFYNNISLRLKVSTFNGKGSTINQNTKYYYYSTDCQDAYLPINHDSAGLGLFNCQTNSCTFSNLILKGSVQCDAINTATGNHLDYDFNTITSTRHLSAAMLFATVNTSANPTLESVALQDVDVRGVRFVGGMIGYLPKSRTTITNNENIASFGIKVHGAGNVGGMIGRSYEGSISIDNGNAQYSIVEVVSECISRSGNDYDYGVGGFIGNARGSKTATDTVTIQNVTIGTDDQEIATKVECQDAQINAGGLVGILNRPAFTIKDCTIYNQSVISQYNSAGLIGYYATPAGDAVISNVTIKCREDLNCVVTSTNLSAGGFIGAAKRDAHTVTIENSNISGYTISGFEYVGGAVGLWGHYSGDNQNYSNRLITNNFRVSNCTIESTKTGGYAGGIVGYINRDETNTKGSGESLKNTYKEYYGYNVLENNITVQGTNSGSLCGGTLLPDYNIIKIAGFSRQEEGGTHSMIQPMVGKTAGSTGSYGTGGYVVFADYNGDCLGTAGSNYSNTFSTVNDSSNVAITYTDDSGNKINFPFVTSSTQTNIGGTYFITSDGASSDAYFNIASDSALEARGYYDLAKNNLVFEPGYITDFASANAQITSHLSTYQEEMGDSAVSGIDFPLLIVDDVTRRNTTALINDYLRLLTNTTYEFNYSNNSNSAIFDTVLCKCTFSADNMTLTISSSDSCLQMNDTYFYMTASNTDTTAETPQFSLIDVQFKDPTDPTKVAYHLYVPVLVKKLLEYDFDLHLESGTDYVPSAAINENTLLENLGVPITAEFKYTYLRTTAEWQSAVDGGDSLLANYPKELQFTNSSLEKDGVRAGFEADNTYYDCNTRMVLVDSQNGSKAYYCNSLSSSAFEEKTADNWILDLQQFKDSSGSSFAPVSFNDLMTVAATQSNDGKFVCIDQAGGTATVKDNSGGSLNGKTFRLLEDGDPPGVTLYNITVLDAADVSEHYFLSIFTEADYGDENVDIPVYHYAITSPKSLGTTPYPSRVDDNSTAHLLTGNIYENTFVISPKSNECDMYHADHREGDDYVIEATFTSTVAITPEAREIVDQYVKTVDTIEIYQSFLATLNMKNGGTSEQGIKAIKNTSVENYRVGGDQPTLIDTTVNSNYAEFKNNTNLRQKLATGNVIISADIKLIFDDEDIVGGADNNPPAQFYPGHAAGVGTTLIGYSNIASNRAKTAYSKTSWKNEDEDRLYYYNSTEEVQLEYNAYADNEIGLYGQLGINANDLDENPVPITTLATYDISKFQVSANSADYLRIEVELLTIDNGYNSSATCNIADYLKGLSFFTNSTPTYTDTSNAKKWIYMYPKSAFAIESQTYQIPINYSIYTGNTAAFEQSSRKYSNYQVKITVSMWKDDENNGGQYVLIGNSGDSDFIKYTNARIYTERVNPNKP